MDDLAQAFHNYEQDGGDSSVMNSYGHFDQDYGNTYDEVRANWSSSGRHGGGN